MSKKKLSPQQNDDQKITITVASNGYSVNSDLNWDRTIAYLIMSLIAGIRQYPDISFNELVKALQDRWYQEFGEHPSNPMTRLAMVALRNELKPTDEHQVTIQKIDEFLAKTANEPVATASTTQRTDIPVHAPLHVRTAEADPHQIDLHLTGALSLGSGILDRHGVEIYTGDLIKTLAGKTQEIKYGRFSTGADSSVTAFYAEDIKTHKTYTFSATDEIVGNVWQ